MAALILYPAIDLKGGACVRLVRGDMEAATVMNADPADQAARFAADGFDWLHVVDLDGAIEGRAINAAAVASILSATTLPVQLGGGVRDRSAVERWLEAGVARVILGTAAVRDPDLVREAARAHPGRLAVAVDVRDGHVAVAGWVEASSLTAAEVARRFEDAGVAALIVTDVGRDGTLAGVDVEAAGALADMVATPVIASGGVASIDDIVALKARSGRAIAGVVLGKALYAGRIDAAAALRVAA